MDFLRKLYRLIKIVIPKLISRETLGIASLSALLVLRTVLSIYISEVNGSIVKAIVDIKPIKFIEQVSLINN
jgi:hypothetical protein